MSESTQGAGHDGSVVFARFGHKSVPYASPDERSLLLLARLRPDIVDIDRNPIALTISEPLRAVMQPPFLVHHADGSRALVAIDARPDTARALRRVRAFEEAARLAGLDLRFEDAAALRVGRAHEDAIRIEAFARPGFPPEWSLAGYECLYTRSPTSVSELQTNLPKGVDASAVALRLAWLGEITFENGGEIGADRRFRHTPVRIEATGRAANGGAR